MVSEPEKTVTSTSHVIIPAATLTQVVQQNQRRRALILTAAQGSSFFSPVNDVSIAVGTNPNNPGLNLASNLPLVLSRELHHSLATCAWYAFAPSTPDVAIVIESLDK